MTDEERLLTIRAERAAYRFEIKKTPAEIAAEVDMDEFDPETQLRLNALLRSGNFTEFAAEVGLARLAAAQQGNKSE